MLSTASSSTIITELHPYLQPGHTTGVESCYHASAQRVLTPSLVPRVFLGINNISHNNRNAACESNSTNANHTEK